MAWVWLGSVGLFVLACAALLAAFSTFDLAWAALLAAGVAVTLAWLGAAAVLSMRRRWSRRLLLLWAAWPVAVGVVGLLDATDLPLAARVLASEGKLRDLAEAARESRPRGGRAGLVLVFETEVKDGHVFLTCGRSLDGIAGLIHVPEGAEPIPHPGWALTRFRRLYGPWWYFKTAT